MGEVHGRGVEIASPPSPLGNGHLRTEPRCVFPVQMSGRALEDPKDKKVHISAFICPTEKYNLSNRMHFHLGVYASFCDSIT